MSAEKVPIQDHLDTSVTASLEDQHLIWVSWVGVSVLSWVLFDFSKFWFSGYFKQEYFQMSVVTSLPLLCHASETFGQAW